MDNTWKASIRKLNLDGDIYWEGAKVKSRYPFDIKIGELVFH